MAYTAIHCISLNVNIIHIVTDLNLKGYLNSQGCATTRNDCNSLRLLHAMHLHSVFSEDAQIIIAVVFWRVSILVGTVE